MRYLALVVLNLPILLVAILNIVTRYKLNKIDKIRFRQQIFFWILITIIICASFPIYNIYIGNPIFKSDLFSWFDIIQTTIVIYLIYSTSRLRQHLDIVEKTQRELHQELSIKLSSYEK